MSTLKSIVVDDHQPAVEQLVQTISKTCPQVDIVDHLPVVPDSLYKIDKVAPDLIFFDTGGNEYSGLEILSDWESSGRFQFILTDTNLLPQNIEFSVPITDYLTKPICPKQLTKAIERVIDRRSFISIREEVVQMYKKLQSHLQPKVAIPTMSGLDMIDYNQIVYFEATDNYSFLRMLDGRRILCSQSLGKLAGRMEYYPFVRIHRKSLVNLNHVCKYLKGDGGQVLMHNGECLNVSRKNKEELLKRLFE